MPGKSAGFQRELIQKYSGAENRGLVSYPETSAERESLCFWFLLDSMRWEPSFNPKDSITAPTESNVHIIRELQIHTVIMFQYVTSCVWPGPLLIFLYLALTKKTLDTHLRCRVYLLVLRLYQYIWLSDRSAVRDVIIHFFSSTKHSHWCKNMPVNWKSNTIPVAWVAIIRFDKKTKSCISR